MTVEMQEIAEQVEAGFQPRTVAFLCNWNAWSGAEAAGLSRKGYPANISLIRLQCLGRIHSGLILKAFEYGADGVILVGCGSGSCRYHWGTDRAGEAFEQTRQLVRLLGLEDERLELAWVSPAAGETFSQKITAFVENIRRLGRSPLAASPNGREP